MPGRSDCMSVWRRSACPRARCRRCLNLLIWMKAGVRLTRGEVDRVTKEPHAFFTKQSSDHATLYHLREIEEDDDGRVADGGVMTREDQAAGFGFHAEGSDVVASLVAGVEELAGGIEVEAAWVVPACPFLAHEGQLAVLADREDSNAVVQ